jgi:hypothetical protein
MSKEGVLVLCFSYIPDNFNIYIYAQSTHIPCLGLYKYLSDPT